MLIHRFRALSFILLLLCVTIPAVVAPKTSYAETQAEISLTTERVIVFKDGYCLVVKKGTATTDENGIAFTSEVPDSAVLGSFWAIPEKGIIKSMVAGWDESEIETSQEINCINITEIIKANVGKDCSFEHGNTELKGKILKLLSNDGLTPPVAHRTQPHFSSLNPTARMGALQNSLRSTTVTGQYFILQTDKGEVIVATNSVKNLTIDGMVSTMDRTSTKILLKKKLSLKFDKPNSQVKINLMYFRPDVRWIPTYRINLTDKDYPLKAKGAKGKENS